MMKYTYIAYFLLLVQMVRCTSSNNQDHQSASVHHESALHKIKSHQDSITYDITIEPYLSEFKKVLAEVNDTVRYLIPERKSHIQSFPCSNCHSKPLSALHHEFPKEQKKAHWNTNLIHAPADVMECKSCHNINNLDQLQLLTGKPVDFDQSFKTCSQCHSTQFKDWVGGSHGKRLGGWAPPKVMSTCVTCHNPHKPAFESRMPSRLNTLSPSKLQEK
jgi:hypothetical protein